MRPGHQENGDFIRHCARRRTPMISAKLGGHALFTISDRIFEKMVKGKQRHDPIPYTRVRGGMNDVYDIAYNYGTRKRETAC